MERVIIAIDPGFDRMGVAVMKKAEREEILFSDCVVTNSKDPHEERLQEIGLELKKIISKWKPTELAIEKLYFNQNITTAIRVAEARGVILYEASLSKIKIFEYNPQQIKIAVTGYGNAKKEQVETMVLKLVSLPPKKKKRLDDEMDAIALGLTHLAHKRN